MSSLMTTLQQPLSMAVLAQCLGWATGRLPGPKGAAQRRRRRRPQPASVPTAAVPDQGPASAEVAGPTDGGQCGWFDSSHELHQGLVVLEHAGAEGLGRDLPLDDWLGFVLDGVPQPPVQTLQPGSQGIITA